MPLLETAKKRITRVRAAHSDLPEEIYKWVEKLASANDGLTALENFLDEHGRK